MEDQEFEGKTTEEAIQNASRELNIPEEDLDIDIIEPGSAGIFGLVGGKKARIRVHLRRAETSTDEETFFDEELSSDEGMSEEELSSDEEETSFEERMPEERMPEEEKFFRAEAPVTRLTQDEINVAQDTLRHILALIPLEATVGVDDADEKVTLLIEGDKSGLLIGRKGKTLDALQFIVNKIVNKALDKKVSIVVDSENYRKRREEILTQMALRMGDKAKRIKKPVTTSPLNPHERRIIHLALKEDGRLDTKSRGDGLLKRVVIIPKR